MRDLLFIGMPVILITEGWLLLGLFDISMNRGIRTTLSLPLGAFLNTLVFFVMTVAGSALTMFAIGTLHFLVVFVLLIFHNHAHFEAKGPIIKFDRDQNIYSFHPAWIWRCISTMCGIIIAATIVFSSTHSVVLPTFPYDSATNWNMRSKISFTESRIVFDHSEGLIRKPQYPFLYHSLQLAMHTGQREWSDRAANTVHFLLSLSSLSALFLMVRRMKGSRIASVTLAIIIGTPLFAMHLGQGYADITLVNFALLSLASFALYKSSRQIGWLILSATFVAACVWTKSEGILFCLLPWLALIGMEWKNAVNMRRQFIGTAFLAIILSLPWPVFAVLKGIPLSPHGAGDMALQFRTDAILAFKDALFVHGSFGILWYAIFAALSIVIFALARKSGALLDRRYISGLLWGLLALGGYMAVYLLTPNAEYLINGQSFDRQMLLPSALLTLSLILIFTPVENRAPKSGH